MSDMTPNNQSASMPKLFFGRVCMRVVGVLALVCVLLALCVYVAMGTQSGSRFILQKIAKQTGLTLNYKKGNLRDGVWLDDLAINQGQDVEVFVKDAYVKMGWRSLLSRQVHLNKADIGTIKIINHQPPSGEPFDYMPITTPVALRIDTAKIDKIILSQTTKDDVVLYDINAIKAKWQGTKVNLGTGQVGVQVGDGKIVDVKNIKGSIDFTGEYPLNATATAVVNGLDKHYIGAFDVHATGTLKRTVGTVSGTYNDAPITGQVVVQGLDDDTPLMVDLAFEDVLIPYADSQEIRLKDGTVHLTGTVSKMDLRINADLTAKDAPDGRYHGRASLVPNKGMDVHFLTAKTDKGILVADGRLDWDNDFFMSTKARSDSFDLHLAVPDEYKDYAEYLPKTLDGTVGFDFGVKNQNDETYYKINLNQNAGERLSANITQKNSDKDNNPNPIAISADWQDYQRKNLSLLGDVNSPNGKADLTIFDDKIAIDANANIDELLGLPKGEYQANLDKVGDELIIKSSAFAGEMGELSATGKVVLADTLSYDIKANTPMLNPNAYLGKDKTPIKTLQGELHVKGKFIQNAKTDEVPLDIVSSDLKATLNDGQSVGVSGKGLANVQLTSDNKGKNLSRIEVDFSGKLSTTGFAKGLENNDFAIKAKGNLDSIDIHKLTLSGKAGHISVGGTVDLSDGIGWRANVHADELDTRQFHDKAMVLVSGDFESVGKFKDDKLGHTTGQFTGTVQSFDERLPTGDVSLDVVAVGNKYTINRLGYKGVAGTLTATGYVDVAKGIVADVSATMTDFNVGHFVKDHPSKLTGDVAGFVNWQEHEQIIDVRQLAITGVMSDEPVAMTGTLSAHLNLPKDLKGYFARLKKPKFDLDKLTSGGLYDSLGKIGQEISHQASTLQDTLADSDKKLRRLIKSLTVRDVMVMFGDNTLGMTGNENKLAINMDAKALSQIIPTIRGEVAGSLVLMGDDNSLPTIYSDLKLANISMPSFALRQGSVLAKVVNLANDQSSAVVQGVGVVVLGQNLRELRVDSSGTQYHHTLALFVNDGKMQARTRVQGGFDGVRYRGVLSEGRFETRYGVMNQLQPFELDFDTATTTARLAPHCWQTLSANSPSGTRGAICLKNTLAVSPNAGKIAMTVDALDMSVLTPLLPSDLSLRARINGKINAQWGKNIKPKIDLVLYSDNGEIGLRQDGLPDTTMTYQRLSVIAQSALSGLKLRTDIKAGQAGEGYVDVLLDPYQDDKPIKGVLSLNKFNLAVLRPFLPAIQTLAGELNAKGALSGTLTKPLFDGDVLLKGGQLALADVPLRLGQIELGATVQGTHAIFDGTFVGGEGKGELTGVVDWQRDLMAKFAVKGNELLISQPPLLSANVSPHFEILVRPAQKYVDIKGVVAIPSAVIRPPESTDTVVTQSADVMVIDRRMRADVAKLLADVAPWRINADIGVDLGDEVVFRGFGARLPLAGALHLTQKGQGVMTARGVVQVSERTAVDIIGQNLELNYGQVRFDGSLTNPHLSIEAIREIGNQTVGMRVKGTASMPVISVFNDAGLNEEQAMNALITGRLSQEDNAQFSEQGFRSQVTNSLAAAGLSLGLQSTHGFTNNIGQALGLDSLVVDASGSNDDANINVTGYITPDLYIRYGVGVFNARSSLSMRYQLTRRVYVEATSGIERIVDVVYRWRF